MEVMRVCRDGHGTGRWCELAEIPSEEDREGRVDVHGILNTSPITLLRLPQEQALAHNTI
jgi:hypothetical protein